MRLDIQFVCSQCAKSSRVNFNWVRHSWTNLREALEHLKEYPDHDIQAETEFNL